MRKKIIAGNWKMNTTLNEGVRLVEEKRYGFCPAKTGVKPW